MKYIVVIGDGMAGWPLPARQNKTTLSLANTPSFDLLVRHGELGLVGNTPTGMKPGSDVANLSIFGYDPRLYYSGRAPIEAISLGLDLKSDDVVFRANLVNVTDGVMKDFTADHIKSEVASALIDKLNDAMKTKFPGVKLYAGSSYRNLCVISGFNDTIQAEAPHDISGQAVANHYPIGPGAALISDIMEFSKSILSGSPATQLWLWGQGKKMSIPSFQEKYGLSGGVISAVDLIKGIGLAAGLSVIKVPGLTGFMDTNFIGKATYALEALKHLDIVFIHVEAPDEAGHMGLDALKVKAIEHVDHDVVKTLLDGINDQDVRLLLLPDHATPVEQKTHTDDLVPYVIYDTMLKGESPLRFTEVDAAKTGNIVEEGHLLIDRLILRS
jgi:2,3-bisphosphoglycerate-independent phosphoglycerate mutase